MLPIHFTALFPLMVHVLSNFLFVHSFIRFFASVCLAKRRNILLFFGFDCNVQVVGSLFPDQGLNLGPQQ